MNSDIIQGKWKQASGDVKKFFGKLSDNDLQQINGNSEKMLGVLQERYGYSRDQAETEWKKFTKDRGDMWNDASNSVKDAAHDAGNAIKDTAHDMKNAVKDKATDLKNAVKR